MKRSFVPLLFGALLLTGCTSAGASVGPNGPTTGSTARAIDCGSVTLTQNSAGRIPEPKLSCFVAAANAQHRARLSVTESTTEGDPIIWIYTSVTGGKVSVVVDSRQDKFAGVGNHLTVQLCDHPTADRGHLLLSSCSAPAVSAGEPGDA